jgi:hypothetical protein
MNVRSIAFLSFLQRSRLGSVSLRMMANQCVGIILNSCVVVDSSVISDELMQRDDETELTASLRAVNHQSGNAMTYDLFGTFTRTDTTSQISPSLFNPKVTLSFSSLSFD